MCITIPEVPYTSCNKGLRNASCESGRGQNQFPKQSTSPGHQLNRIYSRNCQLKELWQTQKKNKDTCKVNLKNHILSSYIIEIYSFCMYVSGDRFDIHSLCRILQVLSYVWINASPSLFFRILHLKLCLEALCCHYLFLRKRCASLWEGIRWLSVGRPQAHPT